MTVEFAIGMAVIGIAFAMGYLAGSAMSAPYMQFKDKE